MRVVYSGYTEDHKIRLAEIGYDDYADKSEVEKVQYLTCLMEKLGWKIDVVGCGYASCEVDDMDDFKSFMADWKECKKEAKALKWNWDALELIH